MAKCKKDVTPLLTHCSYVFLALSHWYNRTSLKGPPLSVVLNERWSLIRGEINMICKDLASKMGHFVYFCGDIPGLKKGASTFWDYSRLAPSQWETSLQSNSVCHWLGANLESALIFIEMHTPEWLDNYNFEIYICPTDRILLWVKSQSHGADMTYVTWCAFLFI